MHMRLKYVLPMVQVLLAIGLLISGNEWEKAMMKHYDMPGTPPSFPLLIALNAPLAIPRSLVFRHLPGWWDEITLVVAIGVFWYWVALNIESWRQNRRLLMFSWKPLRMAVDIVAVGNGVISAFALWHDRWHDLPQLPSLNDWLWYASWAGLWLLWCVVLIVLFGRDFVQAVSQASHP